VHTDLLFFSTILVVSGKVCGVGATTLLVEKLEGMAEMTLSDRVIHQELLNFRAYLFRFG
jgi:hypothetical protein